jgi:hypothetical protein
LLAKEGKDIDIDDLGPIKDTATR